MTLKGAIERGEGKAGHWRVEKDGQDHNLYHYATCMLSWCEKADGSAEVLYLTLGHGSVSDQGGMNTAFYVLDLPYRYDRDRRGGGARIVNWKTREVIL